MPGCQTWGSSAIFYKSNPQILKPIIDVKSAIHQRKRVKI
jgi:hypothetical protein